MVLPGLPVHGPSACPSELEREVARRRTFAIISHPDAGKTTLTEKLLLYGGAIHLAGSVKARRARRHATSDWMELEKERGISVTSLGAPVRLPGHAVNLLDTPGHQDFSEDTYRTLAAADAAVMLIDAAKGVEPQTKKLFKVCRMRGIPIFTFVNKLDRYGARAAGADGRAGAGARHPRLPDELAHRHGAGVPRRLRPAARKWCTSSPRRAATASREVRGAQRVARLAGDRAAARRARAASSSSEDIELLDIGGDAFNREKVDAGQLTPMFFGSAMTNFGVRPFLDAFLELAPPPGAAPDRRRAREPDRRPKFTGFVFKIQANMDPSHRDRIAFLRVVSRPLRARA